MKLPNDMLGLSEDVMREQAPAIFNKVNRMSDHYKLLCTKDIIDSFKEHDYYPMGAQQQRPTRRDPRVVSHVVTMRHADQINNPGSEALQILIHNSHNGRTKLRMYAGIYRFVCSNGLVIGEHSFKYETAHTGSAIERVGQFVAELNETLPVINGTINEWKGKEMSNAQQSRFAESAKRLRWGEKCPFATEDVLKVRRQEDAGNSLWTVFNRVQENCMRGGLEAQSVTGRSLTARPIKQADRMIDFNRGLWDLAAAA